MENYDNRSDFSEENFQTAINNSAPEINSGAESEQSIIAEHNRFYERLKYKKKIRREARGISLSVIFFFLISFFAGNVIYIIMSKLGYSYEEIREIIKEPVFSEVFNLLLSVFFFTVPFIVVQKVMGKKISKLVPIKKVSIETAVPLFFFGAAFCAFANIIISFLSLFFNNVNYNIPTPENPTGFFGVIISVISTAIVPALVEEFACRGIILGSLRKFGDGFAVVVSAVIFGLLHGNFEQIPFAFMVGLALGFIVVKTNSLLVAMLVHAENNLVSVIFSYIPDSVPQEFQNIAYILLLCILLLLGIFSLKITSVKKDIFSIKTEQGDVLKREKYKWFFTSPFIITVIILALLESMIYFYI
ncbi:MAG: CPBP family intramembrane metalloprotease [Clostridia bacterium]|nr:CPBP family intramembrane metalloprotease [Clostridia bacterium]